jgi:hypothetical protein
MFTGTNRALVAALAVKLEEAAGELRAILGDSKLCRRRLARVLATVELCGEAALASVRDPAELAQKRARRKRKGE